MDIGTLQVSDIATNKNAGNASEEQNPNSWRVLAATRLDLAELYWLQPKRKRNLKLGCYSQKTRRTIGKKTESFWTVIARRRLGNGKLARWWWRFRTASWLESLCKIWRKDKTGRNAQKLHTRQAYMCGLADQRRIRSWLACCWRNGLGSVPAENWPNLKTPLWKVHRDNYRARLTSFIINKTFDLNTTFVKVRHPKWIIGSGDDLF
jgi:hypothetical protein